MKKVAMDRSNISRRDVLKQTGAGAAALTAVGLGGSGTVSAGKGTGIDILIQPVDYGVSKSSLNHVREALEDLFEQLNNYTELLSVPHTIDVEGRTILDEYFDNDYSEADFGACDKVETDPIEEGGFKHDILVTVKSEGRWSGANFPRVWNGTESDIPTAHISTGAVDDYRFNYTLTDESVQRFRNATKQEVGHLLMENSEAYDESGYDGSEDNHAEHALGQITEDGASTPMITFYESEETSFCQWDGSDVNAHDADLSGVGDCSSDADWDGSITPEITDCTARAILYSLFGHGLTDH